MAVSSDTVSVSASTRDSGTYRVIAVIASNEGSGEPALPRCLA